MENNNNVNINNFATELSELIGQYIGLNYIYPSTKGLSVYIQPPKTGAPMLLHHYRGGFFIYIHPDDFESISSGKVSAHDYITSANWQVGYYWGGFSMIGGGYYQPLDLIGRKDEFRRYLQILSCRGDKISDGYMPSEKQCADCSVANCPFSEYKEGNWDAEIPETDPRVDLFKALRVRFEQENPGYTLGRLWCGKIPEGVIKISPNERLTEDAPFAFTASVSASVIQSLLMHEIEPENWNDYAKSFQFRITEKEGNQTYDVTKENLEKSYEEFGYIKKTNTQSKEGNEEKVSRMARVIAFFKKMF